MKYRSVLGNIDEFVGVVVVMSMITYVTLHLLSANYEINTTMYVVLFIVLCFIYYGLPQTKREGFAKWVGIKPDNSRTEKVLSKAVKIMLIILFIILATLILVYLL